MDRTATRYFNSKVYIHHCYYRGNSKYSIGELKVCEIEKEI